MKRKTFDLILTAVGGALTVILVVAGALLLVGANYANNSVHDQLARQEITFPTAKTMNTKHSENYISRSVQLPYAGQQVLTGAQAKAYAYKVQMDIYGLPFHGVYSKISSYAMTHPSTKKMAALVTVSFKGTTLQGLLLEAYAFSQFGLIATDGAIAAFCLALLMLVLTGLGLWHVRRTPVTEEFPKSYADESRKAA
jgi:ABC-type branched-subunit amino acid transport system permease subunit